MEIRVLGPLDADQTAQVSALVQRATDADGVSPLSEHVMLHLRHGGDEPVRNLLVLASETDDGTGTTSPAEPTDTAETAEERPRLAAFAHLDVTDVVEGASAELVVDPAWRGQGVGRRLAEALLAQSPDGRLRLWAHGEHPAAARIASDLGLARTRRLLQLRRSLRAPLPRPTLPDSVSVRTFRPGTDDDAWVALNARAFAAHPEQGSWTRADLQRRLVEPWFDPAGFFLAERAPGPPGDGGGQGSGPQSRHLVGFHWTKVHGHPPSHGHDPIGEVYIVGVDPAEQGHGLGRALTLVGLQHLRSLGLTDVMLYVEADNVAAIHVYEDLGFSQWDADVMYSRAQPSRATVTAPDVTRNG